MTQDPLKYLRTQVAAAEASLKRARNNMRAEAERLKLSTSGIFERESRSSFQIGPAAVIAGSIDASREVERASAEINRCSCCSRNKVRLATASTLVLAAA